MELRALCINVGGRADERIPFILDQHRGNPYDMYCFLETMWEQGSWGNVSFHGYQAHHCTRPAPIVRTAGRPSGGITVLLREDSPILGASTPVRVRMDASTGIVRVTSERHALTIAVCYFSPPNSNVYASGLVDGQYLQALYDYMHEATAAGRHVLCLGDLNIRVGELSDDVEGVPMDAGPVAGLGATVTGAVPAVRRSEDRTVDSHAEGLMLGLNSCGCVLLNGRAPGDESGLHTCFVNGGCSVVDYGIVSAGLFASVRSFRVLDRQGELESKDHAALSVCVNMQQALQATAPAGARCPRTLRPRGQQRREFVEALNSREAELANLQAAVDTGTVSWGDAVTQLVAITRAAAEETLQPNGGSQQAGSHAPWFTSDCTQARDAFKAAWHAWWVASQQNLAPLVVDGLHNTMLECRRTYKQVLGHAKRAYQHMHLEGLITTYFSERQRDFWKVLKGGRGATCPVSDVHEWTAHFSNIMGAQPADQQLTMEELAARQALYDTVRQEDSVFEGLNQLVEETEVAHVLGTLPTGKAPDLQGLTSELLKAPATAGEDADAAQAADAEPSYACPVFVKCMTSVMQQALTSASGGACAALACSKATPVPKPQALQTPADKDCYRPVGVGSVFGRVLDRILQRRLDRVVEGAGIRAPTQCGFRGKYGCLDALFTMQHLISKVQWPGQGPTGEQSMLWAVFVDFRKAFDLVRRDLLIARCRELGVHGPFLDAIQALYDGVLVRVCVNGRLGPAFQTHRGTRQGSELSPLLFGLFMDLLHELILQRVPGAGPVIGILRVPDVMYADDVNLLAWTHSHAQQLLDCLSMFCRLFDMEVNLDKTHVVVFRRPRVACPTQALTYREQPLQYVDECTYLGLQLHATKGFNAASSLLAVKGRKALLGLLHLLRLHHVSQGDLRMRLFDILVEPVLSYGAHIWGPLMCSKWMTAGYSSRACEADHVHFLFLRELYGAHRTASRDVLLRDTHRASLPCRWLSLAASWWEKLIAMEPNRLARQVWVADIDLMLRGCVECWTFHLLEGLEEIGFVVADQWRSGTPGVTVETIKAICVTKEAVLQAALRYQAAHWQAIIAASTDPRGGVSAGTHLRTHVTWVHELEPNTVHGRANAPRFHHLCLPRGIIRCLGRYRLGGQHLYGRLHGQGTAQRQACPLCSGGGLRPEWQGTLASRCGGDRPEDLLHFVWECPAYDHIRDRYASVFAFGNAVSSHKCMTAVFGTTHQSQLARCIAAMDVYRRHLLGKGNLFGVRPIEQPEGYVAVMPYPACLRNEAGYRLIPHSGWLQALHSDTVALAAAALAIAVLWVLLSVIAHQIMTRML